jgi:hypothetical protein
MDVPNPAPDEGLEPASGQPRPRRRPPGRPRRVDLTPQQRHAILVLVLTDNCALAGRVVGVDERTVRRWRRDDPEFRDELYRRRAEILIEIEEDSAQVRAEILARRRKLINSEDDAVAWRVVQWHLSRYDRMIDRFMTSSEVVIPDELEARLDALDDGEEREGGLG